MERRDFLLKGMEVGRFDESGLPRRTGRYRYEPYRGPGHHDVQEQLLAGLHPRCYYDADDVRISFAVCDNPEFGVFELRDFATTPRDKG